MLLHFIAVLFTCLYAETPSLLIISFNFMDTRVEPVQCSRSHFKACSRCPCHNEASNACSRRPPQIEASSAAYTFLQVSGLDEISLLKNLPHIT